VLNLDPGIEVIGFGVDAYDARDKILQLEPDVITLDLEMPRMDGLTFLKLIRKHHPTPVIVVSSFTQSGSAKALEALAEGAIGVIGKPDGTRTMGEVGQELALQIRAAADSKKRVFKINSTPTIPATALIAAGNYGVGRVILIGASTGGVEALRYLLPRLPRGLPPIVIVQHIPANFSNLMANNLNTLCPYEVREAVDGDDLRAGLCLIAPGGVHMMLTSSGMGYRIKLDQSPPVHHCRPSVEVLFKSGAEIARHRAVGVLLTGMGVDGAKGLLDLKNTGARTIVESEESCIVFGMPQAAIRIGAAENIEPLEKIPRAILDALARPLTPVHTL
jgi:two-component system, chemotaxis family, protein-glutamate methylesterase/glutaminase